MRVTAANSSYPTNFTHLVVGKDFAAVYELHLSSLLLKFTSTLRKMRNNILETTFMLISASKKVSSKK